MNMTIKGKNIEITSALKEHAAKKLGRLERIMEIKDVTITMSVERNLHKIEVSMILNGYILRGEVSSDDMYSSIDLVTDKMEKQLIKYKEKIQRRSKKQKQPTPAEIIPDLPAFEDDEFVRIKTFAIEPMSTEEAVMQMNMLGHSFFVFLNSETDTVNVAYVRLDGRFGLLVPEY